MATVAWCFFETIPLEIRGEGRFMALVTERARVASRPVQPPPVIESERVTRARLGSVSFVADAVMKSHVKEVGQHASLWCVNHCDA